MILSRISRAIREQNWFAVAVEFVIVIAGVVIGFQVTAWNEARGERIREANYIERLHAEIGELELMRGWRVRNRQNQAVRLVEFADFLRGRSDVAPGEEHCTAIGASHVVTNPTDHLGVLDELLSVGGFDTIRSSEVREAIAHYMLATRRAANANTGSEAQTFILHNQFPDLLETTTVLIRPDDTLLRSEFECDFDAMLTDVAFRHAFAENAFSFTSHTHQNRLVSEALGDLHEAVDEALGLQADHNRQAEDAS